MSDVLKNYTVYCEKVKSVGVLYLGGLNEVKGELIQEFRQESNGLEREVLAC